MASGSRGQLAPVTLSRTWPGGTARVVWVTASSTASRPPKVAHDWMPHPLRFGLKHGGQDVTADELRQIWRIADQGGFDHIWVWDHLAGIGPGRPDRPVFESWALQSAMAVATQRARIGCLVTGNTYRHPALLAKLAATVDHLSGGRLEFGIGTGWAEVEHAMYGIEGLDHRVGRLDESLQILRSLWTQPRTTLEGRYYAVRDAVCNPKPVQQPHPPIWIGAGGDQTMMLAARYADVWSPSVAVRTAEDHSGASARLDDMCARIGRDPGTLRRSVRHTWDGVSRSQMVDMAGDMARRGFTEQIIVLPANDAVRIASRAAEALEDLRALQP